MKLNEVIELNGKEYTVELNRESAVKIEQYVNMAEILEKINQPLYLDKSNGSDKEEIDNKIKYIISYIITLKNASAKS